MIDNILNLLFLCPHRHLSSPVTARSKSEVDRGESYVVCLDCGKHFTYDLKAMRVGRPIVRSAIAGVLEPERRRRRKSKLRYAAWVSAISAGLLIGKGVAKRKKRRREAAATAAPDQDASGSQSIPKGADRSGPS